MAMTYEEIAARLAEADFNDPTWFMAVQIATDEMENMKLREMADMYYHGISAIKGTSRGDFMLWVAEEAEAWGLSAADWLNEVAPVKRERPKRKNHD